MSLLLYRHWEFLWIHFYLLIITVIIIITVFWMASAYVWQKKTLCSIWEAFIYGRLKPEKRRYIVTHTTEGTMTIIRISWCQSLFQKNPALSAGRNVSSIFPWGPSWRVKIGAFGAMDYSLPTSRNIRELWRKKMTSVRQKMVHHRLSLVLVGHGNGIGLFFQVLSTKPLSSSFKNRWILAQILFWVRWKRQGLWNDWTSYTFEGISLILNFTDSSSLWPLPSASPVLLTVQAKLCMVFVN